MADGEGSVEQRRVRPVGPADGPGGRGDDPARDVETFAGLAGEDLAADHMPGGVGVTVREDGDVVAVVVKDVEVDPVRCEQRRGRSVDVDRRCSDDAFDVLNGDADRVGPVERLEPQRAAFAAEAGRAGEPVGAACCRQGQTSEAQQTGTYEQPQQRARGSRPGHGPETTSAAAASADSAAACRSGVQGSVIVRLRSG